MKLCNMIKMGLLTLTFALVNVAAIAADTSSPIGYWKTMDNGQASSIVQVTEKNNVLEGKVVKLYGNPDATCKKCTGDMQDKPIMGATVLWGFTQLQNGNWSDGKVLAVKRGQVFDSGLALSSDGEKLLVNVKAGLGDHLQTWERVSGPNG